MDYQALLFNPIYSEFGVTATITPVSSADALELSVIDATRRYQVSNQETTLESIKLVAAVRMVELLAGGLTRSDLNQASITFNGGTWIIEATAPAPSPNGEADGELYLLLLEQ